MGAAGAVYANGAPVEDLQDVLVIDGRVVIPGFFAPVLRNQTFEICVTTYQTTPFGCTDNFCYNISVVDTTAPVFHNLPRDPVVVDAPAGWCNSFVNFEYPWANDDCMGLYSRIEQVDLTGLKSGDLFPVGLTILSYTATDTVGNQSYAELKVIVNDFHTPPTIVCKPSVAQVNDADMCGAVVDNIEPVSVEDNCINNVSILYEILDSTNKPISCGFEDASGFKFPVGTNKVTYNVYDQPLILITEIVQNGIITGVEITNFGPDVKAAIVSDSMGCAPLKVQFGNLSKQTKKFIWEFGDQNNTIYSTEKDTNTQFTYKNPGVYYVHIIGGDSFYNPTTGNKYYCSVRHPAPGQKQLRVTVFETVKTMFNSPETVCLGDTVEF